MHPRPSLGPNRIHPGGRPILQPRLPPHRKPKILAQCIDLIVVLAEWERATFTDERIDPRHVIRERHEPILNLPKLAGHALDLAVGRRRGIKREPWPAAAKLLKQRLAATCVLYDNLAASQCH